MHACMQAHIHVYTHLHVLPAAARIGDAALPTPYGTPPLHCGESANLPLHHKKNIICFFIIYSIYIYIYTYIYIC